ncbi:MAG: FMN-binding negative transcriptional regulator [Bacteriovorax sp.]|nr:FMN-binding negative transcriptional regulator [Bacteriovorax sp.]
MSHQLKFETKEIKNLLQIINQYPLASVITHEAGDLVVNHLPVVVEELMDGKLKLWSHFSIHNPLCEQLKKSTEMTIVFQGPNAYINPNWYLENDVPTWNYIAVHVSGNAKIIEDYKVLLTILKKTTEHINSINGEQWKFSIPKDLSSKEKLTSAIIGFSLVPNKIVGKFKLSQNKTKEDQERIIKGLADRNDYFSQEISKCMFERLLHS